MRTARLILGTFAAGVATTAAAVLIYIHLLERKAWR
ncbi:MAG: hypothetical protein JWP32_2884 [Schumannella sp.]|nr:hypothetical protein [Schumannella sp.]